MRDKLTGRPRGFGILLFSKGVSRQNHHIDSREVDVKRAMSREAQHVSSNFNASKGSGGDAYSKTKKIFVGGSPALTDEAFVIILKLMALWLRLLSCLTRLPAVLVGLDLFRVLLKNFHDLNSKQVEEEFSTNQRFLNFRKDLA